MSGHQQLDGPRYRTTVGARYRGSILWASEAGGIGWNSLGVGAPSVLIYTQSIVGLPKNMLAGQASRRLLVTEDPL